MERFVTAAIFDPEAGLEVIKLTIRLPLELGYPVHLLRRALWMAANIRTLDLFLPSSTPRPILAGIHFSNLEAFSTNLPHRTLTAFLSTHRNVSTLVLRACRGPRTSPCPLKALPLSSVSKLMCPAQCCYDIASERFLRAAYQQRLVSLSSTILELMAGSNLRSLAIDTFPDDFQYLSLLPRMAPNLRELGINEKSRTQVWSTKLYSSQ